MTKLLNELCSLIEETANVVTVQRKDFDPMSSTIEDFVTPNPYLGYEFELHVASSLKANKVSRDEVEGVRKECVKLICQLVKSLRRRIPSNIKILRQVSLISVDRALCRRVKPSLVPVLEELHYAVSSITTIEMQWKNLSLVP